MSADNNLPNLSGPQTLKDLFQGWWMGSSLQTELQSLAEWLNQHPRGRKWCEKLTGYGPLEGYQTFLALSARDVSLHPQMIRWWVQRWGRKLKKWAKKAHRSGDPRWAEKLDRGFSRIRDFIQASSKLPNPPVQTFDEIAYHLQQANPRYTNQHGMIWVMNFLRHLPEVSSTQLHHLYHILRHWQYTGYVLEELLDHPRVDKALLDKLADDLRRAEEHNQRNLLSDLSQTALKARSVRTHSRCRAILMEHGQNDGWACYQLLKEAGPEEGRALWPKARINRPEGLLRAVEQNYGHIQSWLPANPVEKLLTHPDRAIRERALRCRIRLGRSEETKS